MRWFIQIALSMALVATMACSSKKSGPDPAAAERCESKGMSSCWECCEKAGYAGGGNDMQSGKCICENDEGEADEDEYEGDDE